MKTGMWIRTVYVGGRRGQGRLREDREAPSPIIDFPTPLLFYSTRHLSHNILVYHIYFVVFVACLLEYKLQEAKVFTYFVPRLIPVQYIEQCRHRLLLHNCMWNQRMREGMNEGRNYVIPIPNTELGNKDSCDD